MLCVCQWLDVNVVIIYIFVVPKFKLMWNIVLISILIKALNNTVIDIKCMKTNNLKVIKFQLLCTAF